MQEPLLSKAINAISQAKHYSLELIRSDGHWNGELLSNATITAEYVFLYQSVGYDLSKDTNALINYFLGDQQADGSWAIAPNYRGDISTTTEAYLALKILGLPNDHEAMVRARRFALAAGGIAKVRIFTRFYLAMFGLFPWDALPQMPPELIFLPSQSSINIYTISSWARSTIVPLSLIIAHRPIYALPNGTLADNDFLDELWVDPTNKFVSYNTKAEIDFLGKIFIVADAALHLAGGLRRTPLRPLARKRCVEWILSRQEKAGDWAGIFPPMHFGVLALLLEGFTLDDPCVRQGLEAVERFAWEDKNGKRAQSCVSPVWDTILMTVGLCDGGMPGEDPNLVKAMTWVKDRQILGPEGDWRVYNPKLAPGGFSFEYHNTWYPDVDDTAAAILAFLKQDPSSIDKPAVTCAATWILGMQNPDGGWAAFDWGNDKLFLNKIPFSDMNSLCDPSTADVTGRILEAYGLMLQIASNQNRVTNPLLEKIRVASARGIDYLCAEQETTGSWYGRWGSNYIYGTSNVLCGLAYFSHGNYMVENMMLTGSRWLKSVQKSDGSWGETLESYRNKDLAGRGPSTPSQTAWALMGLLACTASPDESIDRGVTYLINTQTDISASGKGASWPEKEYTGTGFPNFFYLGYTLYRHYFVLMALGRYVTQAKLSAEKEEKEVLNWDSKDNVDSTRFANGKTGTYSPSLLRDLPITGKGAMIPRWNNNTAVTSIDRRKARRVVPMRVLALGLCRTGTDSLRQALKILGMNGTYHGFAACLENPRDCEIWLDAFRAKYSGQGKPFGRAEFDRLLGHCQAVTDVPAVCFAPELIKAYPEAKVILTNRNIDEWHRSASKNLVAPCYDTRAVITSFITRVFRSETRWARPMMLRVWQDFFRSFDVHGKRVYKEHYATVRRLVPADNILEYDVANNDGWEPLCKFLGVPIPTTITDGGKVVPRPFPRVNSKRELNEKVTRLASSELKKAAEKLFWVLIVPAVVCWFATLMTLLGLERLWSG